MFVEDGCLFFKKMVLKDIALKLFVIPILWIYIYIYVHILHCRLHIDICHMWTVSNNMTYIYIFLSIPTVGGDFKHFLFSSLPGGMIQFDNLTNIFQMGWNHQLYINTLGIMEWSPFLGPFRVEATIGLFVWSYRISYRTSIAERCHHGMRDQEYTPED